MEIMGDSTVLDSDENLIKDRKCYNVERSQGHYCADVLVVE